MTASGGGSGVAGGGTALPVISDVNHVVLPGGETVDLTTAEGVARAEQSLDAEQLSALKGSLQQLGFKRVGDAFVPDDTYGKAETAGMKGPGSTTAGQTSLDSELAAEVFVKNGVPDPFNAATTNQLRARLEGNQQFAEAVGAAKSYFSNPTNANHTDFIGRFKALQAQFPDGNIMELLFVVFRESIDETNQEKKYFLLKLQDFNKMAEQISDYLSYLVDKSQSLSQSSEGAKYPEKVHVAVECKNFDLSTLGTGGQLVTTSAVPRSLDRSGLNDTIKDVESMQETVRNKRQMASTAFQNFDQKANQLYNLMASVLKTINEMRSGTTRNVGS